MSSQIFLQHLNKLCDKKFMKVMDLGYMLKEIKNKIVSFQTDINNINEQINNIQKQIKITTEKTQLLSEIKVLGLKKNDLINKINKLVNLMDRQNDGIKVKLSRLGLDTMYKSSSKDEILFVDYVSDIAINIIELENKFIEKMNNNNDIVYLSDYAKELYRQRNNIIYEIDLFTPFDI